MEDILCVLSLAYSYLAPKYCTISFNLATLPSNSKFKLLLYFFPRRYVLSVSVLHAIKIRICRISSYRISGNNDVITAFFEGYDKAVRPGFGKIQQTGTKKGGDRKLKLNIYQQLFNKLKKALPPTRKLPKTSRK